MTIKDLVSYMIFKSPQGSAWDDLNISIIASERCFIIKLCPIQHESHTHISKTSAPVSSNSVMPSAFCLVTEHAPHAPSKVKVWKSRSPSGTRPKAFFLGSKFSNRACSACVPTRHKANYAFCIMTCFSLSVANYTKRTQQKKVPTISFFWHLDRQSGDTSKCFFIQSQLTTQNIIPITQTTLIFYLKA